MLRSTFYTRLLSLLVLAVAVFPLATEAQTKVKTVPFRYATDGNESSFDPQVKQKTLKLSETDFAILMKISPNEYQVEKHSTHNLDLFWMSPLTFSVGESLEGFGQNSKFVYLITHRMLRQEGTQRLLVYAIDKATGKLQPAKTLFEGPSKGRALRYIASPDGSKLFTYQHIVTKERLNSMRGAVFNEDFENLKEQLYEFADLNSSFSVIPRVDNDGNQFLGFVTDAYKRFVIRRYTPRTEVYGELSTVLGGKFDGASVYMFDHIFQLAPDGQPILATICVDDSTSNYHSLKLAKFNFTDYTVLLPNEFRFSPTFLASLTRFSGNPTDTAPRLVDTYLTDLIVTPENNVLLIAEKSYTNDEYHGGHVAKELLLFRYNEYLTPEWQQVINKDQFASHYKFYSALGYKAAYFNTALQLVTFEKIGEKSDLYLRKLELIDGVPLSPKPLELFKHKDEEPYYMRDFTIWMNDKTLIAVTSTKAGLRLNRITVKDKD